MAYFARINEQNIVEEILAVSNDVVADPAPNDSAGQTFLESLGLAGTWIQTSYNGNIRKNYAGIGYSYDATRDAFIPPQPFPSWTLDDETCLWQPPVPHPGDEGLIWDEAKQEWSQP